MTATYDTITTPARTVLARGERAMNDLIESGRLQRDEYSVLFRLSQGWSWILDRHEPDAAQRCTGCPRPLLGRRPAWPCAPARAICAALTD